MNQATHAHAFKASAKDRRIGIRYVVTLTRGPGMTPDVTVARNIPVADLRAARKLAADAGAVCHNF